MAGVSIVPLSRRFVSVLRTDGLGEAARRSARYVLRRLRGGGRSALTTTYAGGAQVADRYLHGVWQTLARHDAFHMEAAPSVHRNRRQIAMIADLNLPQCRKYRVEQLAGFWRARGVEFEYAHYQDIPRAVRIMQHATHLMEYRLQTGASADMLRYEARRLRLPILYDLDDPLFSVSAYETYRNMDALDPSMKLHFLAEAPKYLGMMNGADVLSVSTPGMAAHAALYSDRPIFVRRNFADEETLAAGAQAMREASAGDGLFRVAFASGSQGHEEDLKEILAPLTEFILARPERRLMVLGHFDGRHLDGALKERCAFLKFSSYDRYLAALAQADCAVMPLCDDAFNRCKSAVRVLDASAVGVPCIVGRVGDQTEVVRHERTGFVAATAEDWMAALRRLAEDPGSAARMGRESRAELERQWRASDRPHIIAPGLIDWVEA